MADTWGIAIGKGQVTLFVKGQSVRLTKDETQALRHALAPCGECDALLPQPNPKERWRYDH